MSDFIDLDPAQKKKIESLAIYRASVTFYATSRGYAKKTTLNKMKRLSTGFDPLEEEFSNLGDETFIIGIDNAEEGKLYSVETVNVGYDWETGHVDDYDLELVEYKKEES